MKASKLFSAAALVGLMMVPLGAMAQSTTPEPQITVTGEGQVETAPDMAMLTMGVTSRGETAAAALAGNSADMAKILAALAEAGIAKGDIQTSSVNLNPVWSNSPTGPSTIEGYEVFNQVTIRLRDLPKLGQVMDSMVQVGVNQLYGLNFGLIDPQPQTDAARTAAVADAKRKAELLAEAAGLKLGEIRAISLSGSQFGGPSVAFARDSGAGEVPVAEGALNVSASVTVTWSLVTPE